MPIDKTHYPNVNIIFAGPAVANPSELLEQEAFGLLLNMVRGQYDYILIDTPPVMSVVDAVYSGRSLIK